LGVDDLNIENVWYVFGDLYRLMFW
jgi:hypothetical protein